MATATNEEGAPTRGPWLVLVLLLLSVGTLIVALPWRDDAPRIDVLQSTSAADTSSIETAAQPALTPAPVRDRTVVTPREATRDARDAAAAVRDEPASGAAPGILEILVRDADTAQPVGGARVEIAHTAVDETHQRAVHTADASGRLRLELAPGEVQAVGWHANHAGGPAEGELAAGATTHVEIELATTRPVAGQILDAATGEPVHGAAVSFWTFSELDRVVTAADGTFHHPRFPNTPRAQQVRVEAPGFGATVRYFSIDEFGRWELAAATKGTEDVTGRGGVPWIELSLVRELGIAGRVVDPLGAPVPGAHVSAEGFYHILPSVASRDEAARLADETGAFALTGLRSDIGHALFVRAPGFAARTLELPASPTLGFELGEIRLEPELLLAGVVVDPEGVPVADISVEIRLDELGGRPTDPDGAFPSTPTSPTDEASPLDTGARIESRYQRTRTAADGTFVFEGLVSNAYRLYVARDRGTLVEESVSLLYGEPTADLQLLLPPECLILAGEVRDENGTVAGAEVEVRRDGLVGRVTTDAHGRFRLAGLDDTRDYELIAVSRSVESGAERRARARAWGFETPVLHLDGR